MHVSWPWQEKHEAEHPGDPSMGGVFSLDSSGRAGSELPFELPRSLQET